jgi:drug/metabolite transporter (DMT)-like permease
MTAPISRARILVLMACHVALTGCGYIVVKFALREFDSLALAFWRLATGLLAMAIVLTHFKWWPKIEKQDRPRMLVLAMLAVPINQVIYIIGMKYSVPSHASLLYGMTAAFALALSAILGYERPRLHKIAAILISLAGILLVVMQGGLPDPNADIFRGDLLVLTAVIAWAVYTVLAKPFVKKYGAIPATMGGLIIGSLLALPFLALPALRQDYTRVTWIGWSSVVYTGIFLTVIAYSVWFTLLKQIDPSQVAILTTPQPVVATSLSALLLGEVVGLPLLFGGLLVIGGIIMMDAPALISRVTKQSSVQ